MDLNYLKLLSKAYPTTPSAISEVINLNAIKCLPKGTEYFFSDLHGEYEGFLYLLKSASGVIRTKVEHLFSQTVSQSERLFLCELIYEPEAQMKKLNLSPLEQNEWYELTIFRLIQVCKCCSTKYTRSKVRKKMPPEYSYILDELLHADNDVDKEFYYREIIRSIVNISNAPSFIIAICRLIQNLCIDCLHIIGDIYDRGPRPDIIINELKNFNDVDIQWGNHDISWMGASCGNLALIANVIRISLHYNNIDLIEDGYGISLRSLAIFASEVYKDDPCEMFIPTIWDDNKYTSISLELAAKMHKAIAVIQFKLESQLIVRHPEYNMNDRALINLIDYQNHTICIDSNVYSLSDSRFPTIDPEYPMRLTSDENILIENLKNSFLHSEPLHKHMSYLFCYGSTYKCVNQNLLFHGCIPLTAGGDFDEIIYNNNSYSGKQLRDCIDDIVNNAYFGPKHSPATQNAIDFMWYLWAGEKSPLFGKSKLASFENYFIADKEASKEQMNPYFFLNDSEEICDKILEEFSLDIRYGHIINGHVPVCFKNGDSPIKANGKLFVIDGGISKAYQNKTGIAGYTLICNSKSINLAHHFPYEILTDPNTGKEFIKRKAPVVEVVKVLNPRVTVAMTDIGKQLSKQTEDLLQLIYAYSNGLIKETKPPKK